ncbi:MAG: YncE family protein [Bacteroidia bacterium]
MNKKLLFSAIMLIVICFVFGNAQAQKPEYKIAKTIQLSGDGGWDYLSVDEVNQKLFVSHSSQVNVVDLKAGKELAVIPETSGVHGIAIANDLNKAFISCGKDSSVLVVDLNSLKVIERVQKTGKNPDCILYDQFSKKVFTFNGRSSNSTVIDANTLKVIATIPLAGKPEFAQTDGKGKIFVNIEDKSSLAIINAVTLKVDKMWSIAPGEEPSGLAFDQLNNRLFSVCGNKLMVVSDAVSGKVVTTCPIGDGCDGVAFDPATKRIFASNGEGTMTVIQQVSADQYKVLETLPTQAGARTITVDKTTHHIYVSGGEYGEGTGRRPVKPNTFKVLDIDPVK